MAERRRGCGSRRPASTASTGWSWSRPPASIWSWSWPGSSSWPFVRMGRVARRSGADSAGPTLRDLADERATSRSPRTSSPETTGATRLNSSGETTPRKPITTAARTRMPRVCETVTLSPSATAWTGVPRVPDEIGAHQRLAVARGEGVARRRAPSRRGASRGGRAASDRAARGDPRSRCRPRPGRRRRRRVAAAGLAGPDPLRVPAAAVPPPVPVPVAPPVPAAGPASSTPAAGSTWVASGSADASGTDERGEGRAAR